MILIIVEYDHGEGRDTVTWLSSGRQDCAGERDFVREATVTLAGMFVSSYPEITLIQKPCCTRRKIRSDHKRF